MDNDFNVYKSQQNNILIELNPEMAKVLCKLVDDSLTNLRLAENHTCSQNDKNGLITLCEDMCRKIRFITALGDLQNDVKRLGNDLHELSILTEKVSEPLPLIDTSILEPIRIRRRIG